MGDSEATAKLLSTWFLDGVLLVLSSVASCLVLVARRTTVIRGFRKRKCLIIGCHILVFVVGVPAWFLVGFWLVPGWFLLGSWLVSGWFLVGSWLVSGWFVVGFWLVHGWFLVDF